MATLTIKNLPDEIYARLTVRAKKNRRSINSEAIVQLEHSLMKADADPAAELREIRRLRKRTAGIFLTQDSLNKAKREGRP
ncbi:MAG: Arc family DNA-binding protein [Blastocatellia bacterium]|nr:Arc family DNA-binding protein [Blastocatellia bacterium]